MAIDRSQRDLYAALSVVLALGILVFANLVAERAFARVDLTAEQRYSLTPPFRSILDKLKAPLQLTYYVSETWPNQYQQRRRDILDKLDEIRSFGKGKIELRVVDPLKDEKAQRKLVQAGVEVTVPEIAKDKTTYSTLFSSLEVTYANKPSVLIPWIEHADDIEYLAASKILELTLEKRPIVAIHAPPALTQGWTPTQGGAPVGGWEWILRGEEDAKKFDVRDIDLTQTSGIPEGTALLILINPRTLSERARYEVTKYLAQGGKVLYIGAPWHANLDLRWQLEDSPSGLEDYFKGLGVEFGKQFVCDASNVRLATRDSLTGHMKEEVLPPFVMVLPQNFNQDHVFLRFLPPLAMPFPAELILHEGKTRDAGLTYDILATSSEHSWREDLAPVYRPDPEKLANRQTFDPKLPLWAKLEGGFPFPWEGKPAPAWPRDDEGVKPPPDPESQQAAQIEKKPGMLMLWSCANSFHAKLVFAQDPQVSRFFRPNAMILNNLAEAFSVGGELSQLRSKRYETRMILKLDGKGEDTKRNVLKALLIAGVPLLLAVFAVVRFALRRGTQTRYERTFAETTGPSSFNP